MKFVLFKNNSNKVDGIAVYTNHEKKSNHLGNIVLLKKIGWGFLACGNEQFITSAELEQIRIRIDTMNSNEKLTDHTTDHTTDRTI